MIWKVLRGINFPNVIFFQRNEILIDLVLKTVSANNVCVTPTWLNKASEGALVAGITRNLRASLAS